MFCWGFHDYLYFKIIITFILIILFLFLFNFLIYSMQSIKIKLR